MANSRLRPNILPREHAGAMLSGLAAILQESAPTRSTSWPWLGPRGNRPGRARSACASRSCLCRTF
eukprot:9261857-Alexandrium_andersonii.AAC.1